MQSTVEKRAQLLAEGIDALVAPFGDLAFFLDLKPPQGDFLADAVAGLSLPQPAISPKYFYDARGSRLFEEITGLEEYYPTRTEQAIIERHADEIGAAIGPHRVVYEYGSGASEKIRRLLALMTEPCGYVASDISREFLLSSASALAREVSAPVGAVCADFTQRVHLPEGIFGPDACWLGYFPGSTIGNLSRNEATSFLSRAADTLGRGAKFLLGVDLEKDPRVLQKAYDDARGVTAKFNLNLLDRIAAELGGALDKTAFRHEAVVIDDPQRVEMRLVAARDTAIEVGGKRFAFAAGDYIHTENSFKYSRDGLERLLAGTPWRLEKFWTDRAGHFATCLLGNG